MNWNVVIDNFVKKYLKRIPLRDAERIAAVFKEFVVNPYAGDIEKMDGEENAWRRRLGSYRIFYEIHQTKKIVYVFDLKRRASNTY